MERIRNSHPSRTIRVVGRILALAVVASGVGILGPATGALGDNYTPPVEVPLRVEPSRAAPGTTVTVTGSGFEPNHTTDIYVVERGGQCWYREDGSGECGDWMARVPIGSFTTDAAGHGTGTVTVPDDEGYGRAGLHVTDDMADGTGVYTIVPPDQLTIPRHDFGDVPADSYYDDAVSWLAYQQVTTGCAPDRYCPDGKLTRGQVAAFLHRLAGFPYHSGDEAPFWDVNPAAYYAEAVAWLYGWGLTTGVDGTNLYEPERPITRAELVTLLWRFSRDDTYHHHGMRDVRHGAWYEPAVGWATAYGITTGVGGAPRFEPDRTITRAEAAAMLHRFGTDTATHSLGYGLSLR